jgi:hypothetical protein
MFATCWTAAVLPVSRPTSRSPMPCHVTPTHGQHAKAGSFPTWRSLHQTSATSLVQPMYSGRHTYQAARTHGGERPLPWRRPVQKCPPGSKVTVLRGGKQNSSTSSLPGMDSGVANVQSAAGISFTRMAANQASCPSTLRATKSSAPTFQVDGVSLLCDVAFGITRPLSLQWLTELSSPTPSTAWFTRAYVPPDVCCQHVLSERVWAKTW